MSQRRLAFLSFVVVLALGGTVFAAGSGPPVRGIPYSGILELDGNPVSATDVQMTFRFFDDATDADFYSETLSVDVDAGRFGVVLGRTGAALPERVFDAAELFVEVEVDGVTVGARRQIYAMPQSVRASVATTLEVRDGQIFNGTPHQSAGTDLGLFSSEGGKYLRLVTAAGGLNVYSDGATSNGYGSTPDLSVEPGQTTIAGALDVTGGIDAASLTTSGDLQVLGRAFGTPQSPAINTDLTMTSDAFVTFSVSVIGNGPRGDAEVMVNGTVVAVESVHFFLGSDTHHRSASLSVAARRGDVVRLNFTPTSGNLSSFDYFTRVVPFAP